MITRLSQLKKILVANRGEIACRVMRTAKRLGIKSVAVYSEADVNAMHVALADEAHCIGKPPATDSYLRGDKILRVAKLSGAQAVHPGYGFLSENAEFAEDCARQGVIFIGPPPSAIRSMGVKSTSKDIMGQAGVPVVPGYHGPDQDVDFLRAKAFEIGFPVMIKAVRGGGGKGMRIAKTPEDFFTSLESAKTEALRSFGDDVVLLEKFIESPRHVEVQVFGDTHGNTVHLFERDCSVQRRHQKVIEQAPGPRIDEELRGRLGATGVRAAQAVGYVGAGTVEFIYDPNDRSFYFMEMNTRLQVEHPVTEMVTGVDLVEWQLRVCSGEKLPLEQGEIQLNGAAIEARIYAECLTPDGDFMPTAGRLHNLSTPLAPNVRVESGVTAGDEVSVHYDPMIAKLVVWAADQESAFTAMGTALADFNIVGVDNNVAFLRRLVSHQDLIEGNVHTEFIPQHRQELLPRQLTHLSLAKAALGIVLREEIDATKSLGVNQNLNDPFVSEPNFRVNGKFSKTINVKCGEAGHSISVRKEEDGWWAVSVDGASHYKMRGSCTLADKGFLDVVAVSEEGTGKTRLSAVGNMLYVFDESDEFSLAVEERTMSPERVQGSRGGGAFCPMPGVVDKVFVRPGDVVQPGDRLAVMIAMKMEHVITATTAGEIEAVLVKAGQNVSKNAPIVRYKTSVNA